jgi:hypothetical protein
LLITHPLKPKKVFRESRRNLSRESQIAGKPRLSPGFPAKPITSLTPKGDPLSTPYEFFMDDKRTWRTRNELDCGRAQYWP